MRITIVCCGLTCLAWASFAAAEEPRSSYPEIIAADNPAAYWRFGEAKGKTVRSIAHSRPGQPEPTDLLEGKLVGDVSLANTGPRNDRFLDFDHENLAVGFDGQGDSIRVADPEDGRLRFSLGESLTLEAWVWLNHINEGQQIYVVGKGRTNGPNFAKDNQNYALRLRGAPDGGTSTAAVSFLFRDADNKADADWHRWTSLGGFLEGTGWHHIAVSYTFGQGKSLKGYIDGIEVEGEWDMGGQSDQAPVVDRDELWIGSSMGGNAAGTFDGLIDEVAIYRTALSSSQIARHYRVAADTQAAPLVQAKPGEVLIEILEGMPDKRSWDFPAPRPSTQYVESLFALTEVPKKYSSKVVVIDRSSPFVVRASSRLELPAGEYRLLLRARSAARLFVDGKQLCETSFLLLNGDGHEAVPELTSAVEEGLRPLPIGHREKLVEFTLDGQPHDFRLEAFVGGRGLRPDLGEICVALARKGEPFYLLSARPAIPLSDAAWLALAAEQVRRLEDLNRQTRRTAGAPEALYWADRHALARKIADAKPAPRVPAPLAVSPTNQPNPIDHLLSAKHAAAKITPAPLADDATFLRRVTLDTVGVIPTVQEQAAFAAEARQAGGSAHARKQVVDRLLADPRWADHWVPYWQDVLAENPGLLKPQLNNTGPFRFWIYESFADNKPLDRFVTELVMMEGSRLAGGPAGFAMATQNDSPMAAKAQILAKAFLGVEMQCARCHDAPYHPVKQRDTFSLAAMLNRTPLKVPMTSTVKFAAGARKPLVEVTLAPGSEVKPAWPFDDLAAGDLPAGILRDANNPRERLAALLTSPTNERFAQVMVNRLWKRYLGRGLVDPVDDWTHGEPSQPELLDYLARELITHDYDLKHVARLILNSQTYQRVVQTAPDGVEADTWRDTFASPTRRRLGAEQLVDSLFLAVGKDFGSEELTFDPEARRPTADFLNFGMPSRAWQFASLSNERDRPALALPVAQSIVDVLVMFGWRESRQNAVSERESDPTVLQPLVLANGVMGSRVARLSDDSAITRLSLEEQPLPKLVERVFQQVLSRSPSADERELFVELLSEGYADRIVKSPNSSSKTKRDARSAVSWSNHLSPEATRIKLAAERAARAGDPPTDQLRSEWRERMEDLLWSLVNSPELAFVP